MRGGQQESSLIANIQEGINAGRDQGRWLRFCDAVQAGASYMPSAEERARARLLLEATLPHDGGGADEIGIEDFDVHDDDIGGDGGDGGGDF